MAAVGPAQVLCLQLHASGRLRGGLRGLSRPRPEAMGPGVQASADLRVQSSSSAGMLLKAPSHAPLVVKSLKVQGDRATVTATGAAGDARLDECAVQGPLWAQK